MGKIFGVGILGAGNISAAYLRLVPQFKGLELRGVADIVPQAAQNRAKEFGVKAMTPDEMLSHSEIDVVVNLTIPATHYSVSMEIVSAGKHAYSEKPFVLSLEEGLALKTAAKARGVVVGSAPDTFLGGAHQQVRALIDAGEIGAVTSGTAYVLGSGAESWHPNPAFFYLPGAGPVLDMGPYYVTNLVQLLGPVKRVAAFANSARAERVVLTPNVAATGTIFPVETPTNIHAVLEFHSGAIIAFGASWDVPSHGHGNMELYGTGGTAYVPDPNFFGGAITTTDDRGVKSTLAPWDHPFGRPNYGDGDAKLANYRGAGLADLMQAFAAGRPARCGIDLALHVVEVLTAILKAGETAGVVTLATTCERPAALGPQDAAALLK